MASVKSRRSAESNIWPGFVDAMTALLMILIFVLSIFMTVQFVMRDTITGQDKKLEGLTADVASLANALGLETQRSEGLQDQVGLLDSQLSDAASEADLQAALVASLTNERDSIAARASELQALSAAEAARASELEQSLVSARGEIDKSAEEAKLAAARREALEMSLAQARTEIDAGTEAARLDAARRDALEGMVKKFEADLAARDSALSDVQADLSQAEKLQLAQAATMLALRNELTSAVAQVSETQAELEARTSALSDAEKARLVELAAAEQLREKLRNSSAEVTAMTLALEEQRAKAEDTLTLLAAAEAAKAALATANAELATSGATALTDVEKQRLALVQANKLLGEQEALSAESQREVALLNQQTGELRKQLNALQGLLDASSAADVEAQVQIQALGTNLNTALARVASEQRKLADEQRKLADEQSKRAELEARENERLKAEATDLKRYRSEFFARVGEVLGGRQGVQVVGDRFVFSSEVLFEPASAVLGNEGRAQIAEVAAVIREVAGEIPDEIDWILRVDGHTDNKPLSGAGSFADNWELSQARALSVVKYLVDFEGIPAERLAATGFGEFQPVDPGISPEALAKNRRIELKFTER